MGIIDLNLRPEINVGGSASGWNPFRRRPKVYSEAAEYDTALTQAVSRASESHDLYCSVGTADFIVPWLQRLYRHAEINYKPAPRIHRVLVRHLPYGLIDDLSRCGALDGEFGSRLGANILSLEKDPVIGSHGVEIEVRPWKRLPAFHGHMYSQDLLIGLWSIDSGGHLHVQSPVTHLSGSRHSDRLEAARKTFIGDS